MKLLPPLKKATVIVSKNDDSNKSMSGTFNVSHMSNNLESAKIMPVQSSRNTIFKFGNQT